MSLQFDRAIARSAAARSSFSPPRVEASCQSAAPCKQACANSGALSAALGGALSGAFYGALSGALSGLDRAAGLMAPLPLATDMLLALALAVSAGCSECGCAKGRSTTLKCAATLRSRASRCLPRAWHRLWAASRIRSMLSSSSDHTCWLASPAARRPLHGLLEAREDVGVCTLRACAEPGRSCSMPAML
eukprot:CAMPEP_0179427004 /NCGR_PEP_ID=MMETSP0799-20121207/13107_1 /TAXON_ID=46947 /ORGANISM="Geminigera cryophila, Strain CCMP2564" /LENGTH=189 /DNA_ID=CAMNT_0021201927 /DNA_START=143 /DNA_END=712 /DNA_ORIENTATION=-